ncbi:cation transporter [Yersinia pestis]|nr:cation transporter [Yersinia pestis]
MKKAALQIEGMSCELCVMSIESALRELGSKSSADLASGTVTVEYDESQQSLEKIKEAIEEHGYKVLQS